MSKLIEASLDGEFAAAVSLVVPGVTFLVGLSALYFVLARLDLGVPFEPLEPFSSGSGQALKVAVRGYSGPYSNSLSA